jgi:hypothetical protein
MNTEPTSLFDINGYPNEAYDALPRTQRKALWADRAHPKAVDAAKAAAKRRKIKQTLIDALQESHLLGYKFFITGRLTICHQRRKDTILIATALRNPKDKPNILQAKIWAAARAIDNCGIVVPISPEVSTKEYIDSLFKMVCT